MRAWYDIAPGNSGFRQNTDHIAESVTSVQTMIEREIRRDIAPSRIVLGGTAVYTLRFALDPNRQVPITQATIGAPDGTRTTVDVANDAREAEVWSQ